jgi:hypothetical protein
MTDLFAGLYEWWGLSPLYATDLADHLRGYDVYCNYDGTPWYSIVGFTMIATSFLVYAFYYHILDRSSWQRRGHWAMFLALNFLINFLIAFAIPFNDLTTGNFCSNLLFSVGDCVGFGLTNGIWSIIIYTAVSALPYPRAQSNNCRNTPWKQ